MFRAMSTTTPPTPPEGEPTVEQMMASLSPEERGHMAAISQKIAQAVSQATTAAEAATAAAEAARSEGAARGLEIPEEVIKQISEGAAAATVHQLRQIGALREDGTPDPNLPAGSAAAGQTGQEPGPDASAGQDAGGSADPAPVTEGKSFAQRFLGL